MTKPVFWLCPPRTLSILDMCAESNCLFCRDANHSDFCWIVPISRVISALRFRMSKFRQTTILRWCQIKKKEVTSICTPIWIPENVSLEVEVKLSAMPCAVGIGLFTRRYWSFVWVHFVTFYNIYCEICSILENVPRCLKNVFHIPEGRHLWLASLVLSMSLVLQ